MNGSPGKGKIPKSPLEKVGWESIPRERRISSLLGPIPQSWPMGRLSRKCGTSGAETIFSPSGFPRELASLATNLLGPAPTEPVNPRSSKIAFLMASATPPRAGENQTTMGHIEKGLIDGCNLNMGGNPPQDPHHPDGGSDVST